jgi:integrase
MSKARNGDGSLRQGQRGKWIVEISISSGPDGKRKRTRRTFNDKDTAKKALRKMVAERDNGLLTVVHNDTVLSFGLHVIRDVKALHVRPGTASDYEDRLRSQIAPYLGKIKIVDLAPEHVERWLSALRNSGKSARTINGARQVLLAICKHALRKRLIPFNPVDLTSSVRIQHDDPTQVREPWSREEANKVMTAARGRLDQSELGIFLCLMLYLGIRPGEALGLRWCDIEEDGQHLWINGTLKNERRFLPDGSAASRLVMVDPKTKASRRRLKIEESLATALMSERRRQGRLQAAARGDWQVTGNVVCTIVGTAVSASNLRRRFKLFLDEIGVRYIRFHDIRHTTATLLLNVADLPIEKVSQALGHTRIDTTKQIYARNIPRYNDDFTEGISGLFPEFRTLSVVPNRAEPRGA